jgi:hypothetical protein
MRCLGGFTVFLFCLVVFSGCAQPQARAPRAEDREQKAEAPAVSVSTGFAPAKVNILPLSEISNPAARPGAPKSGAEPETTLDVYITLLDAFGSQVKAPGVLRFELYEYVTRSAEPKGQRITLWPDFDLTGPVENNKYWRDFLRAYEFELDIRADPTKTYILEATCLCPDGRRLSGDYTLKAASANSRQ